MKKSYFRFFGLILLATLLMPGGDASVTEQKILHPCQEAKNRYNMG